MLQMTTPHISIRLLTLCTVIALTGCGEDVEIDSPISGTIIQSDRTLVSGTFRGSPNTGIAVNGVVAEIDGHRFYANNVPLVPGDNTLTATLTTQEGATTTDRISLTRDGSSPITINAEPESGITPLTVTFNLTNSTGQQPQTINADFDGDGVIDFTATDPAAPITHTYTLPGIYKASITLIDTRNTSHNETVAIMANDAAQMDKKFTTIWSEMNKALISKKTSTVLNALTATAQAKYQPVFATLKPQLPKIIASYSPLQRISITGNIGEYAITRNDNGTSRLFFVYLIKDKDGVWRIDEM